MGLFDSISPEEFTFFFFLFGSLLIFTGAISGYSQFFAANGAGQFFELPVNLVVLPLFNTGNAFIAALAVLLFVYYFTKLIDWFGIGFIGAIIFGSLAIMLGA